MTTANILSQLGSPGVSTGFKNRIINGAMVIDQRNAGASVSVANGAITYGPDRFLAYEDTSASSCTIQQVTDAPTTFSNSLKFTTGTGGTATASQAAVIEQRIEGHNFVDLKFGNSSAQTFTLSFWVKASIAGTYCAAFRNASDTRSLVSTYTVSSANTWEYKTITVAGDTSGTWLITNGTAINVRFDLGSGATYQTSTLNSWQSGLYFTNASQANVIGTSGATFYITGVQLEVGTTATNFDYRSYGTELALCYRYYRRYLNGGSAYTAIGSGLNVVATNLNRVGWTLDIPMRSAPTLNFVNCVSWNGGVGGAVTPNVNYSSTTTIDVDMLTSGLSGAGNGVAAKVLMLSNGYIEVGAEL